MSHGSCSGGGGGGFRRGLFWDGGEATDRGYWRHCSHGPLLELHADRIPWQDHQVRSRLSVYLYLHSYLFVFQITILDYWFWGGWEPIGREGLKSRSHQGLPKSHWIDLVIQSNFENQIITSIGGALFLLSIVISSNEPLFHEMLLLVSVLVSDFLHDYWASRLSVPFLLTHKKEEGKWAFISNYIHGQATAGCNQLIDQMNPGVDSWTKEYWIIIHSRSHFYYGVIVIVFHSLFLLKHILNW